MTVVALPGHIINQPCLQEQVSPGQQVITNQILVGSDCDPIAETEGAQHIENLQRDTFPPPPTKPQDHQESTVGRTQLPRHMKEAGLQR